MNGRLAQLGGGWDRFVRPRHHLDDDFVHTDDTVELVALAIALLSGVVVVVAGVGWGVVRLVRGLVS